MSVGGSAHLLVSYFDPELVEASKDEPGTTEVLSVAGNGRVRWSSLVPVPEFGAGVPSRFRRPSVKLRTCQRCCTLQHNGLGIGDDHAQRWRSGRGDARRRALDALSGEVLQDHEGGEVRP
jgi:hypothetical protein